MQAEAQTLYWFSNDKVTIEVPFFQRPYVWDSGEWDELVNSIETSLDKRMPFIGSFILQKKDNGRYLVIDGQQRITTLSIVVKAYIDSFSNLPVEMKPVFYNIIYSVTYDGLHPVYERRLVPSCVDKEDFDFVMDDKLELSKLNLHSGKIVECYKYFRDYFANNTNEKNIHIGEKLVTNERFFITIVLDEQDDEQKIFDSVNSLGRDLTNSDIIKNYLYQKMKTIVNSEPNKVKKILELHDKKWVDVFYSDERRPFWESSRLLGRIKTNMLESFLKDFGIIKGVYSAYDVGGLEGLAKAYKKHIDEKLTTYDELAAFACDIADYADCFYEYTTNYRSENDFKISNIVNTTLLVLDKTETNTFNAYILKIMKESPNNRDELLFALQKFIIQRLIYKASTKNYNKVCDTLFGSDDPIGYLKQYSKDDIDYSQYPEGLKRVTNAQATLILFLIELIRRKPDEEKYSDALQYNKSLEHIMPVKWFDKWGSVPSYDYDVVTDKYIQITNHDQLVKNRKAYITSIGNMTLLNASLNTSISNESFSIKMDGNKAKKKKGIRDFVGTMSIAKEVVDSYDASPEWNEKNIAERNKKLFDELETYYKFSQ